MMDNVTSCNRENGSKSELWGRKCWVADSLVSLIDSRITFLLETEADAGRLLEDLHRYCEELRVKNGLRSPAVLTWDARFPDAI